MCNKHCIPETTKYVTPTEYYTTEETIYETTKAKVCDMYSAEDACNKIGCKCCGRKDSYNYNSWLNDCKNNLCSNWFYTCGNDFYSCYNYNNNVKSSYDSVCKGHCEESTTPKESSNRGWKSPRKGSGGRH
jgi:hypothetical protein